MQTKGRLTVPLAIREALRVGEGDEVVFNLTSPGHVEVRPRMRRAALLTRQSAETDENQLELGL